MSNQIQQKLMHFQAEPAAENWNKIETALNDQEDYSFADKLLQYQQTPATDNWEKIETQLQQTHIETPAPSIIKRFRIPLKYTAAAASIIFIAVIISLLVNQKSISNETATPAASVQKNNPVELNAFHPEKELPNTREPFQQPTNTTNSINIEKQPATDEASLQKRYIVYANNNGYPVKVSKKLYNIFACSTEEASCRKNIELMQQKAASSTVMASADFSGILDLVKNLEDNQ